MTAPRGVCGMLAVAARPGDGGKHGDGSHPHGRTGRLGQ